MTKYTLSFFLFIYTSLCLSQDVEWACRVIETNDKGKPSTVHGILGVPNVYPHQMIGFSSWNINSNLEDINKESTIFVKLGFCKGIIARQIVIAENFNPGSIEEVEVLDKNGNQKTVFQSGPKSGEDKTRMLIIPFEPLPSEISSVIIHTKPSKVEGANCIDAVGLCSFQGPVHLAVDVYQAPNFSPGIEFLGPSVNTPQDEYLPIISSDGNTLFFARDGDPSNVGKGKGDIWYTQKDIDGKWTPAKNIGKPLNNHDYNFVSSTVDNGRGLLLGNTYPRGGHKSGEGPSITYKNKQGGWSKPVNLEIVNYENNNPHFCFSLANNKNILLMAIEDHSHSFGRQDLYVSFYDSLDAKWSPPLNLGSDVNTVNEENFVFLAPDCKTIYFVSDGYNGYGGLDIYVSKRLDETWQKWSKPQNLGPVINTPNDELSFVITEDETTAYGYKYFNEEQQYDIYCINLNNNDDFQPYSEKKFETSDNTSVIIGRILNKKTGEPIKASIYKIDSSQTKESFKEAWVESKHNGEFKTIVKPKTNLNLVIKANGFFSSNLSITIDSVQETEKEFFLVPIEVGEVINLTNILFQQGQAELLSSSYSELDHMVEFMHTHISIEIRLEGHTDNQGDQKKNLILSEQRVKTVKEYLVLKGVGSKRITIKAYGGNKPLVSNATEESRKLNRRVEVVITKK